MKFYYCFKWSNRLFFLIDEPLKPEFWIAPKMSIHPFISVRRKFAELWMFHRVAHYNYYKSEIRVQQLFRAFSSIKMHFTDSTLTSSIESFTLIKAEFLFMFPKLMRWKKFQNMRFNFSKTKTSHLMITKVSTHL